MAELNWDVEHARWEREMRGLVRSLGFEILRMRHRPKACWPDMITDMEITSWAAWRSLRMRSYEPQDLGVYAISLRCVRQVMAGRAFRPLQARGDRSWADSVHNRRNGVQVRTNQDDFRFSGAVDGEQEESDLKSDWETWKASLTDENRELVEALESGDMERFKAIRGVKRRKRLLADQFREFRRG